MQINTIVTYYNGDNYIKELFDSLRFSVEKARKYFPDLKSQIIVVNDCSKEESRMNLQRSLVASQLMLVSKITQIDNKTNLGVTISRLKGILAAGKGLYHIVDQDDLCSPHIYQKACEHYSRNPFGKDIFVSKVSYIGDKPNKETVKSRIIKLMQRGRVNNIQDHLAAGNPFKTPGVAIFPENSFGDLKVFYGMMDRKVDGADDYLLYIFLLKNGYRFIYSNVYGLTYRLHGENQSKTLEGKFSERSLCGLKKMLEKEIITDKEYKIAEARYKYYGLKTQEIRWYKKAMSLLVMTPVIARSITRKIKT